MKDTGKSSSRKLRRAICYTLYRMDPMDPQKTNSKFQNFEIQNCKCSNYTARLPFWSTKKHYVATKLISYERYGQILFQKVALRYLLHFVQDGSSKSALENLCFSQKCQTSKIGKTSVYISPLTPDQPPL